MSDEILFVSDCHLHSAGGSVTTELLRFIEARADGAHRLYILGDLFEVWLGDDDPAIEHEAVIDALTQLAQSTQVFFIAGNRDFLLGQHFAERVGMTLLAEPEMLELGGSRVVLMHGDTLCTDDRAYQEFRRMVRDPSWQSDFLARPLAERRQIAAGLRNDSVDAMKQKTAEIMDVNPQAVIDCFDQSGADIVIHGHTHRPGVHQYADHRRRYVLGDWNPGPSFLSWSASAGFELVDSRV